MAGPAPRVEGLLRRDARARPPARAPGRFAGRRRAQSPPGGDEKSVSQGVSQRLAHPCRAVRSVAHPRFPPARGPVSHPFPPRWETSKPGLTCDDASRFPRFPPVQRLGTCACVHAGTHRGASRPDPTARQAGHGHEGAGRCSALVSQHGALANLHEREVLPARFVAPSNVTAAVRTDAGVRYGLPMEREPKRRGGGWNGGGKPARGPRRQLTVRVPVQHAEIYERRAAEEGLELGGYLAAELARANGLPVPEWVHPQHASGAEEPLAIAG